MTNSIGDVNLRTLLQVDTLLVLGLMVMSNYTSVLRLKRKVYATPEDYALNHAAFPDTPRVVNADDPIERSRRIHRNHLENVLPFLVLSLLYALTNPSDALFAALLWGFLAVRVVYTLFYSRSMQPHRTIAYTLGALIQFSIALLTLRAALSG
ncbi:MAG TPA: MAPEG family protein [Polyangiaceae bacterium]|nr:MAPEG family protein [Polyangiaceae bacterium]